MTKRDELQHWGIPGMKWKKHKKKKNDDDVKDKLRSLIKKAKSRSNNARKSVVKSINKIKKKAVTNSKPKYKVIDIDKVDHIGKLKRDKKAEAMFRSKKFQKAYKKHEQEKAHEKEVSKVGGKITKYGSIEKKIKREKAKEAAKAAKRRKLSNSVEDAFKEVGLVKKTKKDRLNDALKEVGLKKKSKGEKIGEKTNNILKDLGLKKSKLERMKDEVSGEAGIQYELAKAKAYRKTHNGEAAPFDVTNKNQWKALARSVGLTKSPAKKAADSLTSKIKKRRRR